MPGVNTAVSAKLATDTVERMVLQDDGKLLLGSGSAAADVVLARTGAGQLTVTGTIVSGAQAVAPTIGGLAAGFSAASLSAAATDVAGTANVTVAASTAATVSAATVTFGATHGAAPKSVTLTGAVAASGLNTPRFYISAITATGFTIGTAAASDAAITAHQLFYEVQF